MDWLEDPVNLLNPQEHNLLDYSHIRQSTTCVIVSIMYINHNNKHPNDHKNTVSVDDHQIDNLITFHHKNGRDEQLLIDNC